MATVLCFLLAASGVQWGPEKQLLLRCWQVPSHGRHAWLGWHLVLFSLCETDPALWRAASFINPGQFWSLPLEFHRLFHHFLWLQLQVHSACSLCFPSPFTLSHTRLGCILTIFWYCIPVLCIIFRWAENAHQSKFEALNLNIMFLFSGIIFVLFLTLPRFDSFSFLTFTFCFLN